MSFAPRWSLCFAVAVGSLVGVCSACRGWVARSDMDVAALPELEALRARAEHELTEKDKERSVWTDLARRRTEIAREVAWRRLGLFEAAARFRDLNAARPDDGRMVRFGRPGSNDELCCRQVIAWAEGVLAAEEPARAPLVRAELEAELQQRLSRQGTLRLDE